MPKKSNKGEKNQELVNHKVLTKRGYLLEKSKLTPKEIKKIKEELTVTPSVNTDYGGVAESFPLYQENEKSICVPRYYGASVFGKPDREIGMEAKKIDFKFKGDLRDNQKAIVDTALDTLKKNGGGILQLYCGCGKTVLALKIAAELGLKTLIIVHKTFLQNQWYDRIKEFTNAKIGIIRQNHVDTKNKDIVVGMLQSISMKDYDLDIFDDFQLIICDEVHHFGSRVFSQALRKVGAKYTLGLSATPHRNDGLTKVLFWYLGDIMYKLERKGDKSVIVKIFNYYTKNDNYEEKKRYVKGRGLKPNVPIMLNNLVKVKERNTFIVKILENIVLKDERKIMVLTERLEHVDALKNELDIAIKAKIDAGEIENDEITTSRYIGVMKQYERDDAVKADVIIATYSMAAEGLDIPSLNTLLFATPKKDVIQCVGRILRKQMQDGELNPLVIDIYDHYSIFDGQGKKRIQYYNKKHYTLEYYNALRDKLVAEGDYIKEIYGDDYYELYVDSKQENKYSLDMGKIMDCEIVLSSDQQKQSKDSDSDLDAEFETDKYMFVD